MNYLVDDTLPRAPGIDEHRYGTPSIVIRGFGLTIDDVADVASNDAAVSLSRDPEVVRRIHETHRQVMEAVAADTPLYGVTTAFGGMADIGVPKEAAEALQNNIPWPHKTGAGNLLRVQDIRASMLLRANSLMRGTTGVRMDIMERLAAFLNNGVTPHVHELGSIGASGDLVPLSYIAGAVMGLNDVFRVSMDGRELSAPEALARLGLPRLQLKPKEGLAIINGTSVMSGIAANCVHEARRLFALTLGAHALMFQGLFASNQSFHPFVHGEKPHPGQIWVASQMRRLLEGSRLIRDELVGTRFHRGANLEQDRYSLRCLPQYLGPMADGLAVLASQVEIEMNSATDNPLVDPDTGAFYYCGNFLGQYIGMGMDQLRYFLGLLAKHLDVQIAMLVAPEFNNGLPPSLRGNADRPVNLGLKGLQLTANSIMPLICFHGASLVDRFPTHAEQFNQNINSQGFGSATLARRSVDLFRHYMALALMFGVQAADLRTRKETGRYDARTVLSQASAGLYEAVRKVVDQEPSGDRPYVWNDDEQSLDLHIRAIETDIAADGMIPAAVRQVTESLKGHSLG